MSRVLLIDNVDSFTFNIADLLHRVVGRAPTLWRHDHPAGLRELRQFAAIVVGPGPGRPQVAADMGISQQALAQAHVPVLGVCLGHQGLAHLEGHEVTPMRLPRHGIVSPVRHDGTGVFAGVPSPFQVVRYHSLEVAPSPNSTLSEVAWAGDDGCVMGLADRTRPRWGVQFHPESVLSEHGAQIVANFLRLAGVEVCGSALSLPRGGAGGDAAREGVAVGDVLRPHRVIAADAREVVLGTRRVPGPVDPWLLHDRLTAGSEVSVWLDASDGRGVSVIAVPDGPLSRVLTHRVGAGTESRGRAGTAHHDGPLLDTVDELLAGLRLVEGGELPFEVRPGLLGYLGYELKAETSGAAVHDSAHPDACLVLADRLVVIEHVTGDVHALALVDDDIRVEQERWLGEATELVAGLRGPRAQPSAGTTHAAEPTLPAGAEHDEDGARHTRQQASARHTRQDYLDLVRRCRAFIGAGESYEICLTNQLTWPQRVDPGRLHRALRQLSPVPCAAWLRLPGLDVVGASPERFVAVSADGEVEARPIKGTRPRDPDPERDAALARDLATHVKDRAENLMIVDLLRHDLHRVCRSGSVHVPGLFEVETYASVHQLVSTVRGALADGMRATDVLRSCFPGGSMTGAPKVRTMEILDALEGGPRGVYSGAIGWLGLNGAMDTSIVIRTATVVDGRAQLGVGGAVTALSDPQEEYAETRTKARSLLAALAAVGEPGEGP